VEAEPLFGVLDLSVTFSKEGSFASCAAKQVTNPALPHETKLGRAAKLTLFIHAQPPPFAIAKGRSCRGS
jgi:hypothetical protein